MKENDYNVMVNFKNSIKAIEKMNREIEHHPENKVLLNKAVEGLVEKRIIKDFKKVFYKREIIENNFPESENLLSINYNTAFSYCFAYISKEGFFEQANHLNTVLNDSKTENGFIKFIGFNNKGELVLFIVNNKVLLTKEEKKVLKKFFE